MKNLRKKSMILLLFGAIVIVYNNCAMEAGSVVTASESEVTSLCEAVNSAKIMKASHFDDIPDVSLFLTPPGLDWTAEGTDSLRSEQQYLNVLGAEAAHEIIYKEVSNDFAPIIVAVIDSGVDYNHPDLQKHILRRQGQLVGYDFFSEDSDPMDENGHGTHVAGLIAAEGHNGIGVRGGAPENILIMPIKVFDPRGSLPSSRFNILAESIDYAVAQGADIINMSLGITVNRARFDYDALFAGLKSSIERAVERGVMVVIASGNDNRELNDDIMTYPAKFGSELDGVITVGAYDTTANTISPFSNFSPTYVEVQAPGSMNSGKGLVSTFPNNGYRYLAGTSMATPLTAALVALTKIYLKKNNIELSPRQIEELIKESSYEFTSLQALAQEGRVINYLRLSERLIEIYEAGIKNHPKDLKLNFGETGRLTIKMNSYSPTLKFQWYKNGVVIEEQNKIDLTIRGFSPEDIGTYYVKVELESGEVLTSMSAVVKESEKELCDN